jgi:hypothetical protein
MAHSLMPRPTGGYGEPHITVTLRETSRINVYHAASLAFSSTKRQRTWHVVQLAATRLPSRSVSACRVGAFGFAYRPRAASPLALYSTFPLSQKAGKQAYGPATCRAGGLNA